MCHFHRLGLIFRRKVFSANIILCTSYLPLLPSARESLPVKITCRFYRLRYPPQLYRALRTRPRLTHLFSPCLDFHERRQAGFILGPAHSLSLSICGHPHKMSNKFLGFLIPSHLVTGMITLPINTFICFWATPSLRTSCVNVPSLPSEKS